jgi:2-hydroxy-6-oxonona-2,4-dienedioate hydrolase
LIVATTGPFLLLDRAPPATGPASILRPVRVRATRHEQRDATVLGSVRLRYVDVRPASEHGPPVVLLHGIASRLEEYERLFEHLGMHRRIVAMDLPGNGYSDKPDRPYTLTFLEDAVLGLLDHLRIQRSDLAGGSLGGNLTLRLGHRTPSRFRRLVPWAPGGAWYPMRALAMLNRVASAYQGGVGAFWPVVWIQSRFWYHRAWSGRAAALREAFEHFREVHGRGFARMYFELVCEQLSTSLFPIAPHIGQPTLLLWGDTDHALGMGEGVKQLVKLLPDARLRVFPGARHALASEVPELLAKAVDGFLRDTTATA